MNERIRSTVHCYNVIALLRIRLAIMQRPIGASQPLWAVGSTERSRTAREAGTRMRYLKATK